MGTELQQMRTFWELTALALGLCIGSFLNVVIARVPEGLSILRPPSRCPRCLARIRARDNLPVLGWLLLRGRCRACGQPISPRYPVVELLVGLLFYALMRRYGLDPRTLGYAVFVSLLVAITYIDLDHWIIPHVLTWPGIVVGLGLSFGNPDTGPFASFVGAAAGFAVFALVAFVGARVFKREALGQGDWWLLAMIGAFLGWKALLPVILLASLQGTVVGLLLILLGRAEKGPRAPDAQGVEPAKDPQPPAATADSRPAEAPPPAQPVAPPPAQPPSEMPAAGTKPGEPAAQAGADEAGADKAGADEDDEDDWVPPANAVPFGPFLALAALEQLFVGEWLVSLYERVVGRIAF